MADQAASRFASTNVLFLSLRDFALDTVARQATRRMQLDAAVSAGLKFVPDDERIVLDVADACAVVFLSGAAVALAAVREMQSAATAEARLCLGLNHGPVKPDQREAGPPGLLGDGIDAAAAIAAMAAPGRLLVSKSFRDALSKEAPGHADLLHPAGAFVDARVRSHEVFTFDDAATRRRGRRQAMLGTLVVAVILAVGLGARAVRQNMDAARQPAFLTFEIRPQGEIYVDGELKGKTPPLMRLQLSAGEHALEIRSGRFKPLTMAVNLKPGEEVSIKHSFAVPARKQPGLVDRLQFWK